MVEGHVGEQEPNRGKGSDVRAGRWPELPPQEGMLRGGVASIRGEAVGGAVPATALSETELHHQRAIDRVAVFVDCHLNEPLTLSDLARVSGMSKFHFHRTLLVQTGLTPGQFVAVGRLHAAMGRLACSGSREVRVLQVALDVGFEDPSAFTRSFRRHFGLNPRDVLGAPPPLGHFSLLSRFAVPHRLPTPRVVTLPEFYCYGCEAVGGRNRSFALEAPEAFDATFDYVRRHGIDEPLRPMAVPTGRTWVPPGQLRLLCAFQSPRRLAPKGLLERRIPGGRYITQRHIGPYESRWQTWSKLAVLRGQLPSSGETAKLDGRRPFEIELEREPGGASHPVADIYFPV